MHTRDVAPAKNPAKAAPGRVDHGRFGYARVSTRGQTLEVQLAALGAAASRMRCVRQLAQAAEAGR